MDARTLEALKASICHWRDNVAAETPYQLRLGADFCALCELFNPLRPNKCEGCPVSEDTGVSKCQASPYGAAVDAKWLWQGTPDDPAARDRWRAAAQAELDFLISLLPEGETA